ncbi:MAG TPA: hypothetical protein VM680_18645 [Verrucomicrobiae bacterium]|nr:hypothetical protein [Verrucomicrobiae bacterium]
MDQTLIDAEPAIMTFDSGVFVFKDGITVKINDSVQATAADIVENAGDTIDDVMATISGTPCGEWENLTKLWPYGSYRRGQNIFGADKTAVIHTTSGRKITFMSAAITKSPDLKLNPESSLMGGAEWTCKRKNNTPWSTAESFYKEESAAFSDWSAFDAASVLKVAAAAVWGALSAPWNGIATEEGWDVSFGLNLKWVKDAAVGSVQAFHRGQTVMAKCRPLNVKMTDIQTIHEGLIQGTGARRGKRIASGSNLVLTGEGGSPVVTLTSAALRQPGYAFGEERIRVDEIGFEAQRTYTTGQPQPLYTLA